jgi:hypothetical protein
MSKWNNAGRQLQYYRRFIQHNHSNEIMLTDQLTAMKSKTRPGIDVHQVVLAEAAFDSERTSAGVCVTPAILLFIGKLIRIEMCV